MNNKPQIGDYVEVLKDSGNITNAPWRNKVIDKSDTHHFFDEGVKVGYVLDEKNLESVSTVDGKTSWIYIK